MSLDTLSIPQPDDWHVHLRDGKILAAVLGDTARTFARAIVMPNLTPPITTAKRAAAYRQRIEAHIPPDVTFTPLMTCYLTDNTDPKDLESAFREKLFVAAKLYPAGATTNADHGVTDLARLGRVLNKMQDLGMPLLVHGEVTTPEVDIFDREAVFIEKHLTRLCQRYPEMRVVLEHVTTREGVDFVTAAPPQVAATITPHHLVINRNAMFRGGIRPHYYCLPVAKREHHRKALRAAATSGNPKFFLGTDSAPHLKADKESSCGCAGVYNAATAMSCYAQVFDEEARLERLAGFASHFGADYYGLARNANEITLRKMTQPEASRNIVVEDDSIEAFVPDDPLLWQIESGPTA